MSARLFVVFYLPRYGNFQHWALYVQNGQEHLIIEVVGEHPEFERNIMTENPEQSDTFLHKVFVAVLVQADIPRVKKAAQEVRVDNETVEWDCQDYVLEILDNLVDNFVLNEDDEEYVEARGILKEKRAAIL